MRYFLSVLLCNLLIYLSCQYPTAALNEFPAVELQALKDLYYSTGGGSGSWNWKLVGAHWNFAELNPNPCNEKWQGILCTSDCLGIVCNVQNLTLPSYHLVGKLPSSIGNFSHLKLLDLDSNSLSGNLPKTIGKLTNLQTLSISNNANLKGSIPSGIGNCVKLKTIHLYENGLTGSIPSSIGDLKLLVDLEINNNALNGKIPSTISALVNIQHFIIANNYFTGNILNYLVTMRNILELDVSTNLFNGTIPQDISNWNAITSISIYANSFSGSIPSTIGSLSRLTTLSFSQNQLTGTIPPSIGELKQLTYLYLQTNLLHGSIPAEMGGLSSILKLYLYSNLFTNSIPSSFGNLKTLLSMDLSGNTLNGTISPQLCTMSSLLYMSLFTNTLSGPLPSNMNQLVKLVNLNIYGNAFTGTLPSSVFSMPNVIYVNLYDNFFHGPLPNTIGTVNNVAQLLLYNNHLSGNIPLSIGNLTKLTQLDMSTNFLNGSIPSTFHRLRLLTDLNLYDNQLSGTIPETMGELNRLKYLYLNSNKLQGTIPASIGNIFALAYLNLNNNYLRGSIPEEVGNLTKLIQFYGYTNALTGSIPHTIGQLTKLLQLDFSENLLNGSIPNSLGNASNLVVINFYSNHLTGPIPNTLGQLRGLHSFSVCANEMTGTLPGNMLANMTGLNYLYLCSNYFHGTIPASLGNLTNLIEIYLSENSLTGTIPDIFGSLPKLIDLELYFNKLHGIIPPSVYSLNNLLYLYIHENHLSGTISNSIGELSKLAMVFLDYNRFTGTVPNSIGNCTKLIYFYAEYNLFHGTIPAGFGNLKIMLALFLYDNEFTGTIPNTLGNLQKIADFELEYNYLTGTIPAAIGNATNILYLGLNNNYLVGSVPCSIGNLYELLILTMQHNLLTSGLPTVCFQTFKRLEIALFQENQMQGSLNAVSYWHNLTNINVSSNSFSGNIQSLATVYPMLRSIDFSNNKFTGPLNNVFHYMPELIDLNLAHNQFSGNLYSVFASKLLVLIEISDNKLTGTLPVIVFQLPTLQTFAAVKNCFTGSLPTNSICASTSLTTLALDGLHTAEACQDRFFPGWHSITSYQLESSLEGGLAGCLFNMSGLKTLHLSGNGITGTIPSMRSEDVGSRLSDVSLSYNQLTGSIPSWMQERRWKNLDVSFNKLNGVLESGFAAAVNGSTLKMTVNRLSGDIPSNLLEAEDIDMLQGNIFRCDKSETLGGSSRSLPHKDAEADTYECGSDSVNTAIYIWITLAGTGCCVLIFILRIGKRLRERRMKNSMAVFGTSDQLPDDLDRWSVSSKLDEWKAEIMEWYGEFEKFDEASNDGSSDAMFAIGQGMNLIRKIVWFIALFSLMVLLPTYFALSNYYSTHAYSYIWTVSVVYLSGISPAIIILVFMSIFYVMIGSRMNTSIFDHVRLYFVPTGFSSSKKPFDLKTLPWLSLLIFGWTKYAVKPKVDDLPPNMSRNILLRLAIAIINVVVVMTVNSSYVYLTTLNLGLTEMFFIEVSISIFKIIWSGLVVLRLFSQWLRQCSLVKTSEGESENSEKIARQISHENTVRTKFLIYLVIFNNILAPFLAAAFVDPDCIQYVLQPQQPISASYEKISCTSFRFSINKNFHLSSGCLTYLKSFTSTSYDPPFVYSYQCTSALLTGFVSIYIYRYLITGILLPLVGIFLQYCNEKFGIFEAFQYAWMILIGWKGDEDDAVDHDHQIPTFLALELKALSAQAASKNDNTEAEIPNNAEDDDSSVAPSEPNTPAAASSAYSNKDVSSSLHTTKSLSNITIFDKEAFVVSVIGDIAVLITFGLAFPPLALILAFAVSSNTFYNQMKLGKLVVELRKQLKGIEIDGRKLSRQISVNFTGGGSTLLTRFQLEALRQRIEKECTGLMELFWPTLPSLIVISAFFVGAFLFDIVGDQVNAVNAVWILLVMGTIPIWIWVVEYLYLEWLGRMKPEEIKQEGEEGEQHPEVLVQEEYSTAAVVSPMAVHMKL